MVRAVPLSAAALLLIAVACGGSSATTTTASAPPASAVATTRSPCPPTEAASPPPVSFSDVAAASAESLDPTPSIGRVIADELLGGEFEALHSRFDTVMAGQVSIEDLEAALDEVRAQAPLGARGRERAVQLSPSLRFYGVGVEWGDEVIILTTAFDETGEVSSLLLSPELPLPPDPGAGFASDVDFRLPFDGLWFTFWGGDTAIENYHVTAPVQRHAFDFLVWKDGGTHSGDGSAVGDYWAYGQRVLAPADGTVVTVVDRLPDQVPQTGSDVADPAGNHVVIEVADGEYVLIAHMQAGSIAVAEGDAVDSGQQIGLVGNSGNTSEPHIHIHLQDVPVFTEAGSGLPLDFTGYLANGESVALGRPLADQFVANG